MADTKLSDLPAASDPASADLLYLVQGGSSKKMTWAQVLQTFPLRVTTAQKNAISSPAEGLVVYDTDLHKLCVYTGSWETVTSS